MGQSQQEVTPGWPALQFQLGDLTSSPSGRGRENELLNLKGWNENRKTTLFTQPASLPVKLRLIYQDVAAVLWVHGFQHFTIKESGELGERQRVVAGGGLLQS